jgi:type VI secretion system protein ImpK
MTPEFSKKIDPVFLYVLGLLERIEQGESPPPNVEQERIRGLIDRAEADFGNREDWRLAKYALVSWIDEVLIEAPWTGNKWWEDHVLEFELFGTRNRADEFYFRADDAAKLTRKDALEVYYVGAVLGFRGMYRDAASGNLPDHFPPDLESWARKQAMTIQLSQGLPRITGSPGASQKAGPLEGKFRLVGASAIAACLAVLNIIAVWLIFSPDS